jgi:hypothetical protein
MVLLVPNQFSPFVYAFAWPVLVAALVGRRWRLAAIAAALVAWHLAIVVPPLLPECFNSSALPEDSIHILKRCYSMKLVKIEVICPEVFQ